jgi:hypothetical protein
MRCPNCDEDLKRAERKGIEIDYCPRCRAYGWIEVNWTRSSNARPSSHRKLHIPTTGTRNRSHFLVNCLILIRYLRSSAYAARGFQVRQGYQPSLWLASLGR